MNLKQKATSGFTLIEVMVVVGIIAALAALAYPKLEDMQPRIGLDGFSKDLTRAIIMARGRAISTQRPVIMVFNTSTDNVWFLRDNGCNFQLSVFKSNTSLCDRENIFKDLKGALPANEMPPDIEFGGDSSTLVLAAPYLAVPTGGSCSFCNNNWGAVIFGDDGMATFVDDVDATSPGGIIAIRSKALGTVKFILMSWPTAMPRLL